MVLTATRLRIIVLVLAALLMVPSLALAQGDEQDRPDEDDRSGRSGDDDDDDNETKEDRRGRGQQEKDREDNESDDDETDDNETDDDDRRGRGRGGDRDGRDGRDGGDEREIRQSVSRQVGQLRLADSGVSGSFIAFQISDSGISDYAYRDQVVFTSIAYDPPLAAEEIKMNGAGFKAEGEDAEFKAVDTPNGHFKAENDDGTITLWLAAGFTANLSQERSNEDRKAIRIDGPDFTAYLAGEDEGLHIQNGTIVATEEVRFIVHAPGLRGHLSPRLDQAVQDGQIVAEVLVPEGDDEEPTAVENGPVNLNVSRSRGNVTITIEGHGPGRTMLFDLERDALGRIEDLVILFDGKEIEHADDLDDVLNTSADEEAEYIILVGKEKTQVLVGIPHFSVHTITLQSAGPIEVLTPLLGSPVAFLAAMAVAGAFVAVSWGVRNRRE